MFPNQTVEAFKKTHDVQALYKNLTPLDKKLRQAQTLQNLQAKLNEFLFTTENRLSSIPNPEKIDLLILIKNRFKELTEPQGNKKQALIQFLLSPIEQEIFFEQTKRFLEEKIPKQ